MNALERLISETKAGGKAAEDARQERAAFVAAIQIAKSVFSDLRAGKRVDVVAPSQMMAALLGEPVEAGLAQVDHNASR